jgi:arylsulfatase A-like enzyme
MMLISIKLPRISRLFFLCGAAVGMISGLFAAQPARAPNIVFILADDLGYGELGCYGQQKIQTPNLDRLAEEGIRFTQFYAGSTVCAPSRSVLLTGQHTGHTRVRGNAGAAQPEAQRLLDRDTTVARVLKAAGYATAMIGKWGLGENDTSGDPRRHGFDHVFGYLNQTHAHNHFPSFLWRNGNKVELPNDLVPLGAGPGTGYSTNRVAYAGDLFAAEAHGFIERNRDRPFVLYLSVVTPHANNERSTALGDGHEVPDYGAYAGEPWPDAVKGHAAMVTRLDRDVGDLVGLLQRLGIDERTLVIFTSDNGPHREGGPNYAPEFFAASGPLQGIKRSLHDGGIRVPFIARWPGRIAPNQVSAHVGYFGDVLATCAELAGVEPPPNLDSISFVPTLLGTAGQRMHDALYWEFYERGVSQAVLLEGRWKGIRLLSPDNSIRLFDLQTDLGEQHDVAAENQPFVERIKKIMRQAHVPNDHWSIPDRH